VCGKITWAGCGDHIDSVKAQVPDELWCPGHQPANASADVDQQGDPAAAPERHDGGFFNRLLRH